MVPTSTWRQTPSLCTHTLPGSRTVARLQHPLHMARPTLHQLAQAPHQLDGRAGPGPWAGGPSVTCAPCHCLPHAMPPWHIRTAAHATCRAAWGHTTPVPLWHACRGGTRLATQRSAVEVVGGQQESCEHPPGFTVSSLCFWWRSPTRLPSCRPRVTLAAGHHSNLPCHCHALPVLVLHAAPRGQATRNERACMVCGLPPGLPPGRPRVTLSAPRGRECPPTRTNNLTTLTATHPGCHSSCTPAPRRRAS